MKDAKPRKYLVKPRAVLGNARTEIDRQALFDFYMDTDGKSVFCQICRYSMPFDRRAEGGHCGKCLTLFSKKWGEQVGQREVLGASVCSALKKTCEVDHAQVLKMITPLNLVLCPVCFDLYREYVHHDFLRQSALLEHLLSGDAENFQICSESVRRDSKETTLKFNNKHLCDIRDCLGYEEVVPDSVDRGQLMIDSESCVNARFVASLNDERILVLKAFEVGYNARSSHTVDIYSDICKRGLLTFSSFPPNIDIRYGCALLTLILAELNRDLDPIEFRTVAADLSDEIFMQGGPHHFKLYMQLVADMSTRKTAGNYGDLKTSPGRPVKEQELNWFSRRDNEETGSCGIPSLGLKPSELYEHSDFLNAPLETIINSFNNDRNPTHPRR